MGKKVKQAKAETEVKSAVEAPKTEAKVEGKVTTASVKATEFIRKLHLDWILERNLEPGDLSQLRAQVKAAKAADDEDATTEWASWWTPYKRSDGTEAPGISWRISAPLTGGILILRLYDSGELKATIKVYRSGKGIISGSEPVVRALLARPDLPLWTDTDTASLL